MVRKTISVMVASLAIVGFGVVHAQDKTRAEVKEETKAAGVRGDATADKPTPTGKVVGGESRAAVKAQRGKADGAATAEKPTPTGKVVGGETRAAVKAQRGGVDGAATAETPTPGPKK